MTDLPDGARIRIVAPIRIYRTDPPAKPLRGEPETLAPGELGTVIRGDLFAGRLVQIELDTERDTGVRRLIERTLVEEVIAELDGPNLAEPPSWDGAGSSVEAQRG